MQQFKLKDHFKGFINHALKLAKVLELVDNRKSHVSNRSPRNLRGGDKRAKKKHADASVREDGQRKRHSEDFIPFCLVFG